MTKSFKEHVVVGGNLFGGKPGEKGHIVAILTEEERVQFKECSIMMDAMIPSTSIPYQQAIKTHTVWHELWVSVMEKYNINMAWPLRVCLFTGAIIITE